MFWKIIELISRLVSARRIRHVNKVGEAVALAQSDPEAALAKLEEMERRIHPAVRSMLSLTCGRILDGLGRTEEAEARVILAAKQDPSNLHAHLELAKLSARKYQFKNAKERLLRLAEEPVPEIQDQVRPLLDKLEEIRTGKETARYSKIARQMASHPIGENGKSAGLPADVTLLEHWIDSAPEEAVSHLDELAILLGESIVMSRGGTWRPNISPRYARVVLDTEEILDPFELITNRFTDTSLSLLQKVASLSK